MVTQGTASLPALRSLIVTQQAAMAVAQSRAEFITARAVLAGLVVGAQILIGGVDFYEALMEWDINPDTLAELRAIAGVEEDNNSDAIEA
jgi:hypothetical protein